MKKIYTLIISLLLILNLATAQVPQGFKYQTAIRDNNGAVIANKLVAIKLSLLTGSANGTAIYSEVHNVATNDFGVANLNVGNGTVNLGNFSTIDWGSNTFFLKTEVDVNNGTNFTFMGSSQLLSVPFAMYAAKSANAADDKDKDSTNELQAITLNNNNLQLNKNGGSVDLTKYTIDNNTDSQSISLTGNTLAITRGNFVKINDIDSTNELQQLTLNNNNLQLTKNGGSVDLTKYDKDSQQLVLNGNTLSITKGNSIVLSGAVDLDADPTNEIQNLSLNNDSLKLSKSNFVILLKDNDADSTNEIQSLSIVNDSIQLSKANKIAFPKDYDRDSLNELQTIQQIGNNVTLSKNGGNVKVPSLANIQNGSILFATATGTNNLFLTLQDSISNYTTGMTVNFKVPNSNTGHVTVNINNLGVKPLFKNVLDTMESDDLLQNKMLSIIYDGQKFQLLNQLNNNLIFGDGLMNKKDTIITKFNISNYFQPGNIDRVIFFAPNVTTNYTVPADSILIITRDFSKFGLYSCGTPNTIYILDSGMTLTATNNGILSTAILSKARIKPININCCNLYTVPSTKKLFVTSTYNNAGPNIGGCLLYINGGSPIQFCSISPGLVLPEGSTILLSTNGVGATCNDSNLKGYLFE